MSQCSRPPSTDLVLLPAYRFGQLMAVVVAVSFAFEHGVIVAGISLTVALMTFRILFAIMRGILFPLIEELSRPSQAGDDSQAIGARYGHASAH